MNNTRFKLRVRNAINSFIIAVITTAITALGVGINAGEIPGWDKIKLAIAAGVLAGIGDLVRAFFTNDVKEAQQVLSDENPKENTIAFTNLNTKQIG